MRQFLVAVLALLPLFASAQIVHQFDINAKKAGAKIQPTMYGIFFEDINYAADGGLYAEMVKNRSFEFPQSLMGWRSYGGVEVRNDGPFERCPHYVRLSYSGHRDKHTGLENEGFFGVSLRKDSTYRFSLWARCPEGGASTIVVQLVDNASAADHQSVGETRVAVRGTEWTKYETTVRAGKDVQKGALRLFLRRATDARGKETGAITTTDVEHISLFPTDTWRGRTNGMRRDLAQALYDLRPGVFRFPGGCIVEGTDLDTRYNWKNTVGPVENRPLNENRWHYTFDYRFYPDYYQSYGLGFYEFFQLCEDFGSEALPVLSCGLACQYQNDITDEKKVHVAIDDLQPYIDDALDLIEFANGSPETKWGKVRADMGHPQPFNLKHIAIGNEQWDYEDNPAFTSRLRLFVDAIRRQHPEIKIIGSTGPRPDDNRFKQLQPLMKELGADLYDEHYYADDRWFLTHGKRYDRYDRKGPRVFAGESACHIRGKKWNHFYAALCEAAMMTGFERNADIVHMATYAPLFAHIEGWQWRPDLIWYDNLRSVRTCSYYVQQLFSTNKATNVLPLTMNGNAVAGQPGQDSLFASAALDANTKEIVVKVVNVNTKPQLLQLNINGLTKATHAVTCQTFTANGQTDGMTNLHGTVSAETDTENTLDNPFKLVPASSSTSFSGKTMSATVAPLSLTIYRIKQ